MKKTETGYEPSKSRIIRISAYFAALIVFGIAVVCKLFGLISALNVAKAEFLYNSIMFGIAVSCFLRARHAAEDNGANDSYTMLSNVAVSVVAVFMNIDVFGHTIRKEELWSDLWGWHLCWIICVAIQVTFLSSLGKRLLVEVYHFLRWAKKIFGLLGNIVTGLVDKLAKCDKGILIIVIGDIILLSIRFGNQICAQGVYGTIGNEVFLWKTVRLLFIYFWIGLLPYMTPTLFIGAKKATAKIGQAVLRRLGNRQRSAISRRGKKGRGNKEDRNGESALDRGDIETAEPSEMTGEPVPTEGAEATEEPQAEEEAEVREAPGTAEGAEATEEPRAEEEAEVKEAPGTTEEAEATETAEPTDMTAETATIENGDDQLERGEIKHGDLVAALVCFIVVPLVLAIVEAFSSPEGRAILEGRRPGSFWEAVEHVLKTINTK